MKLVRYQTNGAAKYGILEFDFVFEVKGDVYSDQFDKGPVVGSIEAVALLPPCEPKYITSIGANYVSRCKENNLPVPTSPGAGDRFFIPVEALTGPGDLIYLPPQEVRLEYSGEPVGKGITAQKGMEQPVYYWDPVIGPSGMALYAGKEFPQWEDAFLIGGLVSTGIVVVHLDGDRVAFEERVPLNARIRDVKVGPGGSVYAVTEDPDAGSSQILRLTSDD